MKIKIDLTIISYLLFPNLYIFFFMINIIFCQFRFFRSPKRNFERLLFLVVQVGSQSQREDFSLPVK